MAIEHEPSQTTPADLAALTDSVRRARERVSEEQDAVDEKIEAYDAFIARVRDLPAESPSSAAGVTAGGASGTQVYAESSSTDQCRAVRTAFRETVRPHSVADIDSDESLLATVRSELTDTIAVALAPTTDASFTPDLKGAILSKANARREEAVVTRRAMDREAESIDDAVGVLDDVTTWIVEADETPLSELGFDELRERHRRLATHRERCEELAGERQSVIDSMTTRSLDAGIRHWEVVAYLYQDFPVDHPVLSAIARLDATCESCQRAVRDHLVRRV